MRSEDKVLPFPTIFKGYTININCNQSKQLETIIGREQCLFPVSTTIMAKLLLPEQLLNQSKGGWMQKILGCDDFFVLIHVVTVQMIT